MRSLTHTFLPLLAAFLIAANSPASGADKTDKSAVSLNTISLPSGPGSIEGLGESFQPMLNTGSARYALKIALPPGTAGHTPELKLQYESGFGDGPLGIGWVYGPGSISRQVDKGIPRYVDGPNGVDDDGDGRIDEADELDTFVGPNGEQLVELADGSYRARIEGSFSRYRRVGQGWQVDFRNGSKADFGITPAGRVTDRTGAKVFRWLLERRTDTNGNVIEYRWVTYPGSEGQKYLREIRYGPGTPPWSAFRFVSLVYEDRSDWRKDCRSGFPIRTGKRLKKIQVGIQGIATEQCAAGDWNDDGTTDYLTSRYLLEYDASVPHTSFLHKVTRYGSDGDDRNYLPPITFGYSVFIPPTQVSAADAVMNAENAPLSVMDNGFVDFVDLNRDGLADVLETDLGGGAHTAYLNLGAATRGVHRVIRWDVPRTVVSEDGLAASLNLVEKRVSLADMDGNGLADLVHVTQEGDVFWFPNRGDVSWGSRRTMRLGGTVPPAPFTSEDATTADLDFDKRMDVIMSTDAGYAVWYNLEGEVYSREFRTPGARHLGAVLRFSQPGVHTADMNGDRLPDVVRVRSTSVVCAAGMGHGVFDAAVEIPLPGPSLTSVQVQSAKLTDVNGDGLDDLVIERAEPNDLWVWLNRGNDTFSSRIVVTGLPALANPNTAVRWADLNGNGTTDLVYADSGSVSRLRGLDIGELLGGSAHPNLLVRIENGLGVTATISWRSSTDLCVEARDAGEPWVSTVPFPVSVVTGVRTTTGLDVDLVPGEDSYFKEHVYRDGFYEDRERAFRGFETVTVTSPGDESAPTQVSRHRFYTGGPDGADNDGDGDIDEISPRRHREEDALKGMVRSVETRTADGKIFARDVGTWKVRTIATGADGVEVRWGVKTRSERQIHELADSPQETVRTDFTYDDFGNLTQERRLGALSIEGDESSTTTDYINDTERWILGAPTHVLVTDLAGARAAETLSYYDGADYVGLPLGQVGKGRPTRQLGWVAGDEYVNLARRAYDVWGNVTSALNPSGHRRSVAWDETLHALPVREAIEVGGGNPDLEVGAEYTHGLGVLAASTDFNGNRTTYRYDTFGRLTSIAVPGDTNDLPTQQFVYTMADPARRLLYAYDRSGALSLLADTVSPSSVKTMAREVSGQTGTLDSLKYVDGLGRELCSISEGEEGFIVGGARLFNALGSIRFAYNPYGAQTGDFAPADPAVPKTESRYDALGRVTQGVNPPDADGVLTRIVTAYLPLGVTVTNENGHSRTSLVDGLGRSSEIREPNGAETYVTRYAYDVLGNLTSVVDAHQNVRTMRYDGLSRRVYLGDPDRGKMDYTFDAAGNITRTVDNKNQTVLFEYDGAGRVLAERWVQPDGLRPAAIYHYDSAAADYPEATNLKGRLSWVQDLSGGQFFSFDQRGNSPWWVRRIVDGPSRRDYRFEYAHDALGRTTRHAWPDGDFVQYFYNSRGFLESIPGFVPSIHYNAAGAHTAFSYANGVTTGYEYDPRQRMTRLLATPPMAGDPLQDLNYVFDGVSSIRSISDGRDVAASDPANASQIFQYDPLDRLVRAQGSGYGAIEHQYDAIGNMTFQKSPDAPDPGHIPDPSINHGFMHSGGSSGTHGRGVRLPGSEPGPHALTGTGSDLAYCYDDNGNMSDHNGDRYDWDFRDRLERVRTPTAEVRSVYDHSGSRVMKDVIEQGVERKTYYVTGSYEIRQGSPVKTIFAGGRRVAEVLGQAAPVPSPAEQILHLLPGWNFVSLFLQPENPAIETVLRPIEGHFDAVYEYDASMQEYRGYVPSLGLKEIVALEAHKGYLIRVDAPVTLVVAGSPVSGTSALSGGWNLVGSGSSTVLPVEETFSSLAAVLQSVWCYDTRDGSWSLYLPDGVVGVAPLDSIPAGASCWVSLGSEADHVYGTPPPAVRFYHADHLGSSAVISDSSGRQAERVEYYPYGKIRYSTPSVLSARHTFTGQEYDRETGLMSLGARFYDPAIATFASVDPALEYPGGYAYARANPLRYVDPRGTQAYDFSDPEVMESANSIDFSDPIVTEAALEELRQAEWAERNRQIEESLAEANKELQATVSEYYSFAATRERVRQETRLKESWVRDTRSVKNIQTAIHIGGVVVPAASAAASVGHAAHLSSQASKFRNVNDAIDGWLISSFDYYAPKAAEASVQAGLEVGGASSTALGQGLHSNMTGTTLKVLGAGATLMVVAAALPAAAAAGITVGGVLLVASGGFAVYDITETFVGLGLSEGGSTPTPRGEMGVDRFGLPIVW